MEDLTIKFNENTLKKFKDATEVLGFTNQYAAIDYALNLLQMAKAAKEQGKDLCIVTLDTAANALTLDATISAHPDGLLTVGCNSRSNFKFPFSPKP